MANHRRHGWRLFLLLILFALCAIYLLQAKWVWRVFYPWPYRAEVTAAAKRTGIDPYLLAAVIRVESRFDPEAHSTAGAVGLMQVMPNTAYKVALDVGIKNLNPEMLHQPKVNIDIGSYYLAQLFVYYKGDPIRALAAYNAGIGRVNGWISSGQWKGTSEDLAGIPYQETQVYIKGVLRDYDLYKYLYGQGN